MSVRMSLFRLIKENDWITLDTGYRRLIEECSVTESLSTDQGLEGALSTLSGAWPISLGFLRFKGLGCRSIGCQSCRKIPELNRTAIEVFRMFPHLYHCEG